MELVVGDFFDVSTLPKCDGIFMKHILHDWNDDKCKEILSACHEVKITLLIVKAVHVCRIDCCPPINGRFCWRIVERGVWVASVVFKA